MQHVLDNPAWNALTSGNSHLAYGTETVKYFDPEVSPFIALKDNSEDDFQTLYNIMPHKRTVCFVTPVKRNIPSGWKIQGIFEGMQMVCKNNTAIQLPDIALTPLTYAHVPEMLELTQLTRPGPFAGRTIDFGEYYGIFQDGRLAAMTGQRMKIFNYIEVSAVCTHPDFTGRGYARQLLQQQLQLISAAQGTPILHVRGDNDRAIKVYESLGFEHRSDMNFYFMKKI